MLYKRERRYPKGGIQMEDRLVSMKEAASRFGLGSPRNFPRFAARYEISLVRFGPRCMNSDAAPQQCLNLWPLPQGHAWLRPILLMY